MLPVMKQMVRIFLMWLVLLALPAQGMAQASMFACHLVGNSTSADQITDHSVMNHDGMDHKQHAMSDHVYPDSSEKLMKSLHGCCNCAPTCAVVLLPAVQVNFNAIQRDVMRPASAPQLPNSADIRRIDRPPKSLAV
jgi:hypothetical protein